VILEEEIDSVCTYCGVGCEITAKVQDNKIKTIYAKKETKVSRGKLCVKGKFGWDFVDSSQRLPPVKIRKSFIYKNELYFPKSIRDKFLQGIKEDEEFFYPSLKLAYEMTAWKLQRIFDLYGGDTIAGIGGARSNCESGYIFQKFIREVLFSPHIDNCARVCHAPSLKGMRKVIGEGAATNPFDDIEEAEFIILFGSNITEAHPIAATRISKALKEGKKLALFDVRETHLSSNATYQCTIPYESNLLILNMISFVILSEKLYDVDFITSRTFGFDEYKNSILNDKYANPEFFLKIKGYEYLFDMVKKVAREYAKSRSIILWGLGVTEHIDGSYAVEALCNLAILTGNIGKNGAGLIPLRGQNNVQHIHTNQNKIKTALENLDFLVVLDLFDNETTKKADIIFGVRSAYEKEGVYINAERRLHLSSVLVENNLPDDWEVIVGIAKNISRDFDYQTNFQIWEEVRVQANERFCKASYEALKKHKLTGLQWPVLDKDTPRLHVEDFRTDDKKAHFSYRKYFIRGMIKELLDKKDCGFYLTTGRVIAQYNNASQTKRSPTLLKRHNEDILHVSLKDSEFFKDAKEVILSTRYGKSSA